MLLSLVLVTLLTRPIELDAMRDPVGGLLAGWTYDRVSAVLGPPIFLVSDGWGNPKLADFRYRRGRIVFTVQATFTNARLIEARCSFHIARKPVR